MHYLEAEGGAEAVNRFGSCCEGLRDALNQAVLFCPFCGTSLQAREEVAAATT